MFDTPVAEFPSAPAERTLVSRVDELLVSETLNRALNFSIALVALVVLTPLILLIAIAVKLTSRGPIVYRQTRVGVDRRRSGGDRRAVGERRTPRARLGDSPFGRVFRNPVADPSSGRIGYDVPRPARAVPLVRRGDLPFGVCAPGE